MSRRFEAKLATLWSTSIHHLPQEPMKFALNAAAESLPTNSNLYLWGRKSFSSCPLCKEGKQTLQHVLNGCPKAQELRRYSDRHDKVLENIVSLVQESIPRTTSISVDLPNSHYTFPQHIVPCLQRPDIVWWDDTAKTLVLAELTVSFESSMELAHQLKENKYLDIINQPQESGYEAKLITLEVGSRGLISMQGFNQMRTELGISTKLLDILLLQIIRTVILSSYKIWCSRNYSQ